jgi:hypothetical protein
MDIPFRLPDLVKLHFLGNEYRAPFVEEPLFVLFDRLCGISAVGNDISIGGHHSKENLAFFSNLITTPLNPSFPFCRIYPK